MRIIETITEELKPYLENKKVLEVACGDSDFSLTASKYGEKILATDISLQRLEKRAQKNLPTNIEFIEMNATNLEISEDCFEASVCYNALSHLESILTLVLEEMIRVTEKGGVLIFIATWKMDKVILHELKNIISEYNKLTVHKEINNSKYCTLILKKTI